MLTTLDTLKTALGVSGSSEDTALTQWLAEGSALARQITKQFIGGLISANTAANPTVVTSIGHGLQTGETIVVRGSNSTPVIDGEQVVTVLTRDTFTVPVHVTVAGTAGSYGKVVTEFYSGDGTDKLILRQRPVQSIGAVYLDADGYFGEGEDAFPASSLLTAGSDYCLQRDTTTALAEKSKVGILLRIGGVWPDITRQARGLLSGERSGGMGNIKVTSTVGWGTVPEPTQMAVHMLVGMMRTTQGLGGQIRSLSLDYFSYTLATAAETKDDVLSVKRLLGIGKEWVW